MPDGDTGTNMFLTFEAARAALLEQAPAATPGDLRAGVAAFARGALLGARGNSGVILSPARRRAAAAGSARPAPSDRSAAVFAEGMALATEAATPRSASPVEGTILSVARAAVRGRRRGRRDPATPARRTSSRAAAAAAREALARTPEQLQVLRGAGVVDAGGRGLCVVLDAAETAVTGTPAGARRSRPSAPARSRCRCRPAART